MKNINLKKTFTIISGVSLLLGLSCTWLLNISQIAPLFYLLSIFIGGIYISREALKGITKQKFLNIEFLVLIATIGAILINQLAEAAAVIFFFSLAEMIEEYGIERSRKAVETLIKKTPKTALLKNGKRIPVEEVQINDIVVIQAGELIPVDGRVVKGSSAVDEAAITGEAIPKDKRRGDAVFAGTLNQNGYLEVKTLKTSKDSTFSKIVKLVKQAQKSRAPTQEFIDRFAKYYTPLIVGCAILISIVPPLLLDASFTEWLYRALVILVIACPCALVISTPVSIASALGGASRNGVLIKGGKYLEALTKIKVIAFDKTRTLTLGKPFITESFTFNGFTEKDLLADAAGIEKFSSHPLAKSILKYAQDKGIKPHLMQKYQQITGKGSRASCLICNNITHSIGNQKILKTNLNKQILKRINKLEKKGKTVILVNENDKVMGILAISDKIRGEAQKAIKHLHQLGIHTIMLTGDNSYTANFVAHKIGITEFYASLLPDEKLNKIKELKRKFGFVAMVGDGINDAPSLATATVGIALGDESSDVALETADITLMNKNLLSIPYTIQLGRKTSATIKQNIVISLLVKALFLILATLGLTHLEYAIAADSGIAILVIINSLKLFHFDKRLT